MGGLSNARVPGPTRRTERDAVLDGLTRTRTIGIAAVTALLLVLPAAGRAQTVFGHVLDSLSGRPLPSAAVILLDSAGGSRGYALSDSTGRFVLKAPRGGRYRVYVDQLSYRVLVSDTLALRKGERVELLLRATPVPVALDPMAVTVRREDARLRKAGFYKRERFAMGYFLDPEKVRDEHPFVTSDLLRQVPGVYLVMHGVTGYTPQTRMLASLRPGRWQGGCTMKVVVDGVDFPLDMGFTLDDVVAAQDVLAVEVYPHHGIGAPIQYRGLDSGCGIVMIWTK